MHTYKYSYVQQVGYHSGTPESGGIAPHVLS